MYDTVTRVRLVKNRVRQRQHKQQKCVLGGLSAMCLLLFASLVGAIGTAGFGSPAAPGMYGSMLLYGSAGGYVLVGILSFTAAVVITVLCIRSRENSKKKDHKKEESEL